jgi:methionyl-tRNA formyltransferase
VKFVLLTSMPSAAYQLVYMAQTRGIRFEDVVIVGEDGPKYWLFHDYATVNRFRLHFVPGVNHETTLALLRDLAPDVIKIVTGDLVRRPLLEIPRLGVLNSHAAMLPRYRGVDTPLWAILEGGEVGCVEHFVDEGVDTGDILVSRRLDLRPGDTIPSVLTRNHYENKWQGATEALVQLRDGTARRQPQRPEDGHQYFRMHPKLVALVEARLAKLARDDGADA